MLKNNLENSISQNDVKMPELKLIIIGALAGIANGFFGSGGGLFIVPLLIKLLKFEEKKAFASSVAIVFFLSVVSLIVYITKDSINLVEIWPVLLGGFLGGLISGLIFKNIPTKWLHRLFGALIIFGGIRAVFLL